MATGSDLAKSPDGSCPPKATTDHTEDTDNSWLIRAHPCHLWSVWQLGLHAGDIATDEPHGGHQQQDPRGNIYQGGGGNRPTEAIIFSQVADDQRSRGTTRQPADHVHEAGGGAARLRPNHIKDGRENVGIVESLEQAPGEQCS